MGWADSIHSNPQGGVSSPNAKRNYKGIANNFIDRPKYIYFKIHKNRLKCAMLFFSTEIINSIFNLYYGSKCTDIFPKSDKFQRLLLGKYISITKLNFVLIFHLLDFNSMLKKIVKIKTETLDIPTKMEGLVVAPAYERWGFKLTVAHQIHNAHAPRKRS